MTDSSGTHAGVKFQYSAIHKCMYQFYYGRRTTGGLGWEAKWVPLPHGSHQDDGGRLRGLAPVLLLLAEVAAFPGLLPAVARRQPRAHLRGPAAKSFPLTPFCFKITGNPYRNSKQEHSMA